MASMTSRAKIQKYFLGIIIVTNYFAFEVKATLVHESSFLESQVAPIINRVKV